MLNSLFTNRYFLAGGKSVGVHVTGCRLREHDVISNNQNNENSR